MSNIAGKAYAMNVVTPIKWYRAWINRLIFWAGGLPFFSSHLKGLTTLSLIHYARWALVSPRQFPRLDESQPKETIKYTYMFFFSNFNGSWNQYVDSFHMAIPAGLDLFWHKNIKYPNSIPLQPFHSYINHNQIWTNHYYNAYPLATSNDIKAAIAVKKKLKKFIELNNFDSPELFQKEYNKLLNDVQEHLNLMEPTPIVSLSAEAVEKRRTADHHRFRNRAASSS
ncbi:hypothetical protein [Halomonas heilongjiangensis]|uniref:Uncharacterized protein n=1 Tax=Halomonas heilongjiangensis TaxID=1387883 RepID=A0A2N7TJE2_9GAMM|nr:hypothetical protein [Halomonas heilongjiangensis]PMR68304.1 hypothetical protein C1H66_15870 [Halomonas heilongjiangensis]PXX93154.1 hypothetical protein CR158_05580 [Halomonas heilongjiangensis]